MAVICIIGLALAFTARSTAVSAQVAYVCLPSCDVTDSRMLSLAGTGLQTLAGDMISLEFIAPEGSTNLEIGIFDGDTSGLWDVGTTPLDYDLYADPTGLGDGTLLVGHWSGASMTNNNWYTINVTPAAAAQAASGHYFYNLRVRNTNPTTTTWSNFKVRTNGTSTLKTPQSFAFTASFLPTPATAGPIIYPGWPSIATTTYDGTWDMFLDVASPTTWVAIWDGDFDHGSYDCLTNDTDDLDTQNNIVPFWSVGTQVSLEGVGATTLTCRDAAGNPTSGLMTGNPSDDALNQNLRRTPAIIYTMTDPLGNVYANNNPSGNQEWEQFRLDTNPAEPADHHPASMLPTGLYHVHVTGLDMNNLNAWRFNYDVVGVCADNTACKPVLRPYLIGDTVWFDANANGLQDDNEPGIAGVVVNRLDSNGQVVATTTTDANGYYDFEVNFGTHTAQVAPENFQAGGPLAGLASTTGGEQQTQGTVMTYDFGYNAGNTAALGDYVWYDLNGDSLQDTYETGIPNVTVTLRDSGGNVIATTTTDATGYYSFVGLAAGSYTVTVDSATLPAPLGLMATYDYDGVIFTPHTAAVTLAAGETNNNVDFGYTMGLCPALGAIGDTVWKDLDGDGIQDAGEPGIAGVTVTLTSPGTTNVQVATTDANGFYHFDNLPAGQYTVTVVSSTIPSGMVQTYDLDGIATAHTASLTLAEGEVNDNVDFGYRLPPTGQPIYPLVECVLDNKNGTYTAFFGYDNTNSVPVTIPVGTNNRFSPSPENRGQPTTFAPGRTPVWPNAAFSVVFDGNPLTWKLKGSDNVLRTAVADDKSTPCSYHIFFSKEWYDENGQPLAGPPADVKDFYIYAESSLGSAYCFYPEGSNQLECEYKNHEPALDDVGLWVEYGEGYTVTEHNMPDDWDSGMGFGSFEAGDGYCTTGHNGVTRYCSHTANNHYDEKEEGCTSTFWKTSNNYDEWVGYTTSNLFDTVFGINAPGSYTLLQALNLSGSGEPRLKRHAVAALLNSTHPNINYAYTTAEVITMVQGAYANGNYTAVADLFSAQNNLTCPLDKK